MRPYLKWCARGALLALIFSACGSARPQSSNSASSVPVATWNPESGFVAGNFSVDLSQLQGRSGKAEVGLRDAKGKEVGEVTVEGNFDGENIVGAFDKIDCHPEIRSANLKSFSPSATPFPAEGRLDVWGVRNLDPSEVNFDWDTSIVAESIQPFDRYIVLLQSNADARAAFLQKIPAGSPSIDDQTQDSVRLGMPRAQIFRYVKITICGKSIPIDSYARHMTSPPAFVKDIIDGRFPGQETVLKNPPATSDSLPDGSTSIP
jgi:hypothetical protein